VFIGIDAMVSTTNSGINSRMKEQLNNKILAVHDKITNMVFDQIDKQLELVNISCLQYSGISVANSGVIICGV
jgi:uncharacterized FlaG/YvyC family protein